MTNKEIDNIFPQSYKGTAFISDLRLLVKSLNDGGYLNGGVSAPPEDNREKSITIEEIQEMINTAISNIEIPEPKQVSVEQIAPAQDPGNVDEDSFSPEVDVVFKFNQLLDNLRDVGIIA
jgi:hypothetical protein